MMRKVLIFLPLALVALAVIASISSITPVPSSDAVDALLVMAHPCSSAAETLPKTNRRSNEKSHTILVIRRARRGGRPVLRLAPAGLAHRPGNALAARH